MAGTKGFEPATSDVTGASASSLFSAKYVLPQCVAGDSGRHGPTRYDPFSLPLLTQLLTQVQDGTGSVAQSG
jgi:hypothetical protein